MFKVSARNILEYQIEGSALQAYHLHFKTSEGTFLRNWRKTNHEPNKDLKVPEKPKLKCMGYTYNGAKLFNMLPPQMRETKDTNTFKTMVKNWIWENIPSY